MFAVPGATPVNIPVAAPTLATPAEPELHVPPDVVLLRLDVVPAQTDNVPVIGFGPALTVTTMLWKQPEEWV